jgi:hypothetical protein
MPYKGVLPAVICPGPAMLVMGQSLRLTACGSGVPSCCPLEASCPLARWLGMVQLSIKNEHIYYARGLPTAADCSENEGCVMVVG